jgi:hypothetical protein
VKSRSIASLSAVLVLAVSCASHKPAPQVGIEQVGQVLVMGVAPRGGVPMQYRLTIENPFDYEVRLTAVEIETVGQSGAYALTRVRQPFDQTIAAGASQELNLRAWVRVLTESDTRSVDHPVMLRGRALFETPSGVATRNFFARGNESAKTRTMY